MGIICGTIEDTAGMVRRIVEAFRDAPNNSVDIAVEEIMKTFAAAPASGGRESNEDTWGPIIGDSLDLNDVTQNAEHRSRLGYEFSRLRYALEDARREIAALRSGASGGRDWTNVIALLEDEAAQSDRMSQNSQAPELHQKHARWFREAAAELRSRSAAPRTDKESAT